MWAHSLVLAVLAAGGSADESKAAAEVDRQVRSLAVLPPGEVQLVFDGVKDPRYKLLSGSFDLDGDDLPFAQKKLPAVLYDGKLPEGPHRVSVRLSYNEAQGSGVFEYADYKIGVQGAVQLKSERGLRSVVHIEVIPHGGLAKRRLELASHVDAKMLVRIDDSLPPPPPRLTLATPVDAGTGKPAPSEIGTGDVRQRPPRRSGSAPVRRAGKSIDDENAVAESPPTSAPLAAEAPLTKDAGAASAEAIPLDAGETLDSGQPIAAAPPFVPVEFAASATDRRSLVFGILGVLLLVIGGVYFLLRKQQ